jgi:trigger factor
VLAKPELADWTMLEVAHTETDVPAELVERELEVLRSSVGELVPVEDRPVVEGDTVVLDLVGDETGTQRDYVTEVGAGRLVEELDEALVGMRAGETKTVEVAVDEGETTDVELTLKDVKERVLPELDDELARAASEFDTLAELRNDIGRRLGEELEAELDAKFREDAVDALVDASSVDVPAEVVDRRAAELWSGLARSLGERGISTDTYLTMTGQTSEQVVGRLRAEAARAIQRELVLEALAEQLSLTVADGELETFVREQAAAAEEDDPDATVARLREHGAWERLRGDLRLRKALDELAASVQRIPADLAAAREKLWTPEKEKGGQGVNIWTPGGEEARTA